MTTLIEVRGGDGELIGRCDARCYDAEYSHCDCICGGANHGAGREQAMQNTRELAEQWIEEYAERQGLEEYEGFVAVEALQLPLFAMAEE